MLRRLWVEARIAKECAHVVQAWTAGRLPGESRSAALLRSLRQLLRENTELMHALCLPAARKRSRRLHVRDCPSQHNPA